MVVLLTAPGEDSFRVHADKGRFGLVVHSPAILESHSSNNGYSFILHSRQHRTLFTRAHSDVKPPFEVKFSFSVFFYRRDNNRDLAF